MDEPLSIILIVLGAIIIIIPSGQFKHRKKIQGMPRQTFWRLVIMYLIGAAAIAAGFIISGI